MGRLTSIGIVRRSAARLLPAFALGVAGLLPTLADAEQTLYLSREQAEAAVARLRKQTQVVLYCAEPDCDDDQARVENVSRIESRKHDRHWQLLLNGKAVNPGFVYFAENGQWFNFAIRQGLLMAGVPEQLPVRPFDPSTDCAALAARAEQQERRLIPTLEFKVTGEGRLHFHRAPDRACRDPKVFVVPRDSLLGYAEYKGWIWVMYVNRASGNDFQGWVPEARLQASGTMAPK